MKKILEAVTGKFLEYINSSSIPLGEKKVLFVGQAAYNGGTFTFFRQTCKALQSDGWQIEFANMEAEIFPQVLDWCTNHGIKVHRVRSRLPIFSLLKLKRILDRGGYSLMLTSAGGFDFFDKLFAFPIPTVMFLHSLIVNPIGTENKKLLARYVRPHHRILSVSRAGKADILANLSGTVPENCVSFLYNYVENRNEQLDEIFELPAGRHVITIGHVTDYKNPGLWVETAEEILGNPWAEDVYFTWIGNGDEYDKYRSLTQKNEKIRFIGYRADVGPYLKRAQVLFHPSRTESFGLVVAEAMMFGVPSVASRVGALPELIVDGVTGFLFESGNKAEASRKLEAVLNMEPETLQGLRKQCLQRYEHCFTKEAWLQGFRNIMSEMAQ